MSYGSTPPPGDDRPDPTSNPEQPAEGYGSPPPPPPQYGSTEPPPPAAAPQPGYGQAPPPPPPAYGEQPPPAGYGAPPPPAGYGAPPPADGGYAPPPPPPAYGEQGYGAAPAYTGPYQQGASVGTLAQWPQRALGWVVDFILLRIPFWILYYVGIAQTSGDRNASISPLVWLSFLYLLAIDLYNRWYRGGTTGYSIGRGLAGVKLVRESDGQVVGMGMAFVRDVAHLVDTLICYVGWLFPLWDIKRQTLADKIMSTVVLAQPQTKA